MMFVGGGCDYNDDNFDGLHDGTVVEDVKTLELTLTDADYKAIADNSTNKTLAGDTDKSALAALTTNKYFTQTISASKYVPAFLASNYPTADVSSSVKVTYNYYSGEVSQTEALLETATIVSLAAADYQKVWGQDSENNFFTPSKSAAEYLPAILDGKYPDAAADEMLWVDFNQAETEPSPSEVAFEEAFDDWTTNWANVVTTDNSESAKWVAKSYSGNNYVQCSAYKTTGDTQVYLVSPQIPITDGMTLTFDACYGNYKAEGGRISVFITEDLADGEITKESIAAATWQDITSQVTIPIPSSTYGTLENVCTYDMAPHTGKNIRIAFRYDGNGTDATTTVQIDNVVVMKGVKTPYSTNSLLCRFSGSAWSVYAPASVRQIVKADYLSMGSAYDSFDASMAPGNYLPQLLKQENPYAQIDDVIYTAYKYYDSSSKTRSVRADEYVFDGSAWVADSGVVEQTDQFIKNDKGWVWDPSVTIILTPGKGQELSAKYFQACVDWVKENVVNGGMYITSYGNNDYYSGASAYQNNLDWRVAEARTQYAEGYAGMSDDQVTEALKQHTIEVFAGVLEQLHPEAKVIEGIDVTYTIQLAIYTGTSVSAPTHKLVYKVTGNPAFEFVSFDEL